MSARHIYAADFQNGEDLKENLIGGGGSLELENEQ